MFGGGGLVVLKFQIGNWAIYEGTNHIVALTNFVPNGCCVHSVPKYSSNVMGGGGVNKKTPFN